MRNTLTYEKAETIRRMLMAGIPRKQINQVTGISFPQIATIAIASGQAKAVARRPKAMAAAAPLPAADEQARE